MNGKSVVVVLVLDAVHAVVMVVDGGRVVGYEWSDLEGDLEGT